ncbi:hypothetical protein GCM10009662_07420 [Catellatospora coxensis]|uniref:Uncharacterized protein n=1 Tax=Catellatospora coxensis TaxID=310354 RepID=A0A8J3L2K9_9ACTN|nr:hypothetical protein Cco03nite_80150 [Catellatospora coxensis]
MLRFSVAQQSSVTQTSCARGFRYPHAVTDVRAELAAATRRYRKTEADHDEARRGAISAALAALRAGVGPAEVERLSPFTGAYLRKLAREEGIPPAAPGPKRSA